MFVKRPDGKLRLVVDYRGLNRYLQQLQGEMRIGTEKVMLLGDNCEIFIALNEYCLDAMRQCNIVIRRISHEEELVR